MWEFTQRADVLLPVVPTSTGYCGTHSQLALAAGIYNVGYVIYIYWCVYIMYDMLCIYMYVGYAIYGCVYICI